MGCLGVWNVSLPEREEARWALGFLLSQQTQV